MEDIVKDMVVNSLPSAQSSQWFMFFMALIVLGIVVFIFFWYIGLFKYKVRVRTVTNGRSSIIDDKARSVTIDGVKQWQLLKKKARLPVPPPQALSIGEKGIFCAECMYDEEKDEFHWIVDKVDVSQIKDYQPLTTNQRAMLIQQIRKANDRGGKSWKEIIQQAIPIAACVIIVISLMIFYGDMGKPLLEMGHVQAETAKSMDSCVTKLQEMIENKQIFVQTDSSGALETPPG